MTGTFGGWLIKTKTIDGFGELGRLSKEWTEYRDSRDWTRKMLSFTDYLKHKFPGEAVAYDTYCRLTNYNHVNKDT